MTRFREFGSRRPVVTYPSTVPTVGEINAAVARLIRRFGFNLRRDWRAQAMFDRIDWDVLVAPRTTRVVARWSRSSLKRRGAVWQWRIPRAWRVLRTGYTGDEEDDY